MASTQRKAVYNNFLGIDNVNDSAKVIKRVKGIPMVRLKQGLNVDLHADSHLSRRSGFSLSLAGSFGSVWSNDDICLAVTSGNLVKINPDITATTILNGVGDSDMAYESVSDGSTRVVYFTNSVIIGKIKNDVASLLPATSREFKSVLPAGNMIKFFQSSLYVVKGSVVYISDVLNKGIYDRRWGFKLFESGINMFEPVRDGIYVSDSSWVYFMKRTGTTNEIAATPAFSLIKVFDAAAVPGTPCRLFDITSPSGKKMDQAIVWVSGKTLCLGGDGGQFETIRDDAYRVFLGQQGTSIYRVNKDLKQYITIIR